MTDIKKLIAKQKHFAEELLAEAREYYAATGPVEVKTVFGDTPVKVLMPFMSPKEFEKLTDVHPPRPAHPTDAPLWFNLHAVARNYPGVVVDSDDGQDDLRRIQGDEIRYLWPEIFDEMPPEDQRNFHMAVWAMHVWEPQQRRERKLNREGDPLPEDLPLKDLIDVIVAEDAENA
ncbi:hypothetical protein [Microbacterium sp. K24]|uniref:hypothetical protein n=1 Tax=Microbacterium sp. K24 TaxID=2305446 RepID=UPI00109C71B6|nr:hypothetical protein [Microbacterium sp. K24]